MKKLGKVLKTSKISVKDEQEALREFLRRLNDTPHSTTGVPPNKLLLGLSQSSGILEAPEQREKFRQDACEREQTTQDRNLEQDHPRYYMMDYLARIFS